MTISQVQKEFAEFLRLKPNAPALTHLQQALQVASQISDGKDTNAAKAIQSLVDRHISLLDEEAHDTLERGPPGSRSAKSQYQFFCSALRLFYEYGYRDDKHFVQFIEFLELLTLLEKPLTKYSDKDRAMLKRLAERSKK